MEQQKLTEDKELRIFYAENMLRNKYKVPSDFSDILAKFILELHNKFFADYEPNTLKHIRNAQSNLGLISTPKNKITKFEFYVGLLDKDTLSYKYSKHQAKQKIFEILGDCTIQETSGFYTYDNGLKLEIDTLFVTKFLKEVPDNFVHDKVMELKKVFNQNSIITDEQSSYSIEFNDESDEYVKEVEDLMNEYGFNWEQAKDALESGLF
jgi:hypothetical protein